MRAARIQAWGEPPILQEIGGSKPRRGESLVRMAAASMAHVDVDVSFGRFSARPDLPFTPGTEGSGTVVSSDRFDVGTRVWVRGGGIGRTRDGTWATMLLAPDEGLHPAPDDVDMAIAAAFFSPATTAYLTLHDVAGIAPGERVAITGAAGAVGSLAVQLAADTDASVLGIVSRRERLADVPAAATAVAVEDADVVAAMQSDGGGVDLLVDTVGGERLTKLLEGVRAGGRAALVGYTAGREVRLDLLSLLVGDVRLLPVNMVRRESTAFAIAAGILQRLTDNGLQLPITRYEFGDVAVAWSDLQAGMVRGRAVLVIEPGSTHS